jgi:hypothetical protein
LEKLYLNSFLLGLAAATVSIAAVDVGEKRGGEHRTGEQVGRQA